MNEEKIVNLVVESAKELLEKANLDAEISASLTPAEDKSEEGDKEKKVEKNYVNVSINGQDLGLLIGFQGRTMQSFEQVLSLIVNKKLRGEKSDKADKDENAIMRIVVDVNDYKEKRFKLIHDSALQAIDQAKESGQQVELPIMTPAERRVVHMAVQEEGGVKSTSEGEEGFRRVVIQPE
jgi:spoIIIJ-associated protein